ncbi:hypothetical protein ACFLRG_00630 [Bacteroidota bacterium]
MENTIINETANFIVIPTIGQFIEGWLLIISKYHQISSICHSNSELTELEDLIDSTRKIIELNYGSTIIFEHGPAMDSKINGGCCIDHTHIHIAPYSNKLVFRSNIGHKSIKINNLAEIKKNVSPNQGYLLWGFPSTDEYYNLTILNSSIPRQYLRKVLAASCDMQDFWNWREYPFYLNIYNTIKRLSFEKTNIASAK